MLIQDRYASAIRSNNLAVDERTTYSDSDVLGAFGLAAKDKSMKLPMLLQRLFLGDNGASVAVVEVLSDMVRDRAAALRIRIAQVQADDMAKACLAWHRDGSCKPCGGHGVLVIRGTKTLGDQECKVCKGIGRRPFEREFHESFRGLASWLVAEMERDQSRAGGAAMAKIAPRLDF